MYEQIIAILAEQLQIDPAKIDPDTGWKEDRNHRSAYRSVCCRGFWYS